MIALHDIHKSFGSVKAVRGVGFELRPGEIAGLLGPNGAGKSTTIRVLTGFFRPDKGAATLAGIDMLKTPRKARRLLGYLPESAPLHPEMRTIDTLRFRGRLYGLRGKALQAACERVIGLCALEPVRLRRVGQLSKGYRQRVGLAAAIVHDPPVIVLDEPTNGLDPTQIRTARSLIRELGERKTVLVSSHMLAEVEKTCDRILIIAGGRLRADGRASDLIEAEAAGAVRARCVGDIEAIRGAVAGLGRVEIEAPADHATNPSAPVVVTISPRSHAGDESGTGHGGGAGSGAGAKGRVDPHEVASSLTNRGLRVVEVGLASRGLEDVFVRCVEEASS